VASELPQLFGALKLADILDAFSDALPGNLPNVTTAKNAAGDEVITYTLMATLKSAPSANTIFVPTAGRHRPVPAHGHGDRLGQRAVTYNVNGSITPFSVYLVNNGDLEFIQVPFEAFSFSSQSGARPRSTSASAVSSSRAPSRLSMPGRLLAGPGRERDIHLGHPHPTRGQCLAVLATGRGGRFHPVRVSFWFQRHHPVLR